jgi:hypothetical protein
MVVLTDEQLQLLFATAATVPVQHRDEFLRSFALTVSLQIEIKGETKCANTNTTTTHRTPMTATAS